MKRRKRRMRTSQVVATVVGLFIAITFVITLVVNPGSSSSDPVSNSPQDLPTPVTPPPPPPEEGLEPGTVHIHSTGLYQVFEPTASGWLLYQDNYITSQGRANLIFRGRCAVIHNFVEVGMNYPSPQTLIDEVFTQEYLDAEWTAYRDLEMTQQEIVEPYVVMDFVMKGTPQEGNCPDDYLGRQISWMDDNLLHNVRLVVGADDPESLDQLEDLILPSFVTYPQNTQALSENWRARSNITNQYLIQIPPYWQPDNAAGQIDRFRGTGDMEGYTVNMLTFADTPLVSLQEAERWLQTFRADTSILSHEAVTEQKFGDGYRISYIFSNADGDPFSAVISLLNDAANQLYVAELSVPGSGIDFLMEPPEEDTVIAKAKMIIESFTVLAPSDYVYNPLDQVDESERIFG